MTITNETIIKAAKAAALDAYEKNNLIFVNYRLFEPHISDNDSAKLMDSANVSLYYDTLNASILACVPTREGEEDAYCEVAYGNNKAQSRRNAVILCAAAKWDAMNGGVK